MKKVYDVIIQQRIPGKGSPIQSYKVLAVSVVDAMRPFAVEEVKSIKETGVTFVDVDDRSTYPA